MLYAVYSKYKILMYMYMIIIAICKRADKKRPEGLGDLYEENISPAGYSDC